jgi:hypothetical protein
LGFATTAIFSWWLKLSRNLFLIPYVALVSAFLVLFFTLNRIDVQAMLASNWTWGIVAGALTAAFLVFNVRSQPASRQSRGSKLALEITWAGLVYGLIDALFLSVMPVAAIWTGTSQLTWASTVVGHIAVGAIGLLASLLVSLTYHIGYVEFRGNKIKFTLLGPGIITLAFLVSGNPLGSIISHPVMHVAAVLRGPETTVQLPPHQAVGSAS